MTKRVKIKAIIAISCTTVIILAIILFYLYGWRLFGFAMCYKYPKATAIVTETKVNISGNVIDHGVTYDNYIYKIEDNILYVGIHTNFLDTFGKTSFFNIDIPVNQEISKVIMKGMEGAETVIYDENTIDE